MDKINQYQEYIQKILTDYATFGKVDMDVEIQTIFDREKNHYQVVYAGWKNGKRMYGCVLHLDIKQEKIWIQYNGTELDIPEELVKLGVPKQDIVLAFHSPYMRQFTDYALS